ncbi:MAG: hypothetical protein HWE22_19790 [Flavobacteriales bacterium]|nr:hypothetical protein [Flavobacteriales bacterium]
MNLEVLLNDYWVLANDCYALIRSRMDRGIYSPNGNFKHLGISYSHHGMGFTILLKSEDNLILDFNFNGEGQVSGFKVQFLKGYIDFVCSQNNVQEYSEERIKTEINLLVEKGVLKRVEDNLWNWSDGYKQSHSVQK